MSEYEQFFSLSSRCPSFQLFKILQHCQACHQKYDADLTETDPQELATKAWLALKAGDHEQVSEITTQCFEEFGNEAVKQQKESGEEISKDNAHSFPELNSVGTCLFILAESLSQQGKDEKSQATLQKLITDFPECHCENKEGYYWKPALAAEKRLAEAPEKSG